MCNLEPQGSVHLRSSLYKPRKHLAFLHQILAKVKKSKSAWDLCGGFIPLKDSFLIKSRWHRREHFFLHFLLKAQPEGLKLSHHPYLVLANKSIPDCTLHVRKQPHTATCSGTALLFQDTQEKCNSATLLCLYYLTLAQPWGSTTCSHYHPCATVRHNPWTGLHFSVSSFSWGEKPYSIHQRDQVHSCVLMEV